MPLPTRDMQWPPLDHRIQSALYDWDAWYSSDPIRLQERYGFRGWRNGTSPQHEPHVRGFFGFLTRWFWGTETPIGEKVSKLHVPLAGDIARTSSELLFAEPPSFVFDDDTANQDAVNGLIDDGLHATLLEAAESCAALGGAYLRIVWDDTVKDRPWISVTSADCAVPEFVYGDQLKAVTFWTTVAKSGQMVWRHLERHERGVILHGLYQGTETQLGQAVPLTDQEQTAGLAELVDADGAIETGAPQHLTAVYIPNVRPARAWRRIPQAAGWGQSDYQGIEPLMDALDETYTSWMRDIRLGKSRIIVPQAMLESHGPGRGGRFIEDREMYSGLNMLQRPGDTGQLQVVQFKIRYDEHKATAQDLMAQAVHQAGYSGASFGLDGDGAVMTATEVTARKEKSLATRDRKTLYWKPRLKDITAAWLAVTIAKFGVDGLTVAEPTVEFADGVSESPQELATTAQMLRAAEAASTDTLVRMMHPDWNDDQVADEVIRIQGESGRAVTNPDEVGDEPDSGYPGEPDGDEGQIRPLLR
ncbi:phage portal protein [Streptomyces sp. NPDC004532]